ncbi:hypothetical protein SARC_10627 [Sphaeroforma arctica JP610]|uniref:Uncharacterized protein n=1 Tax=Sphaeroforma arctica JP610 TaxID=667725 RepID=A0A0L0FK90_9EUKA|nr:hypothetical protein SARC_10627 [Sphaeroforma arctica JP610]KNC76896.1 hypothetical protein SARC_10627 [Sphaeroforma arctica JP610]|eukprot:XP_014150798.1 hypothetical protein SARC_10627 [Sphaeroforma arctica JP610]
MIIIDDNSDDEDDDEGDDPGIENMTIILGNMLGEDPGSVEPQVSNTPYISQQSITFATP